MHDQDALRRELGEARKKIAELEARAISAENRCHELELKAQRRFRDFVEKTPAGICITNDQGIFEYVNPAYCEIYQYSEEELIGRHFTIVVPEEDRQMLTAKHDAFIQGRGEVRGEWTVLRKDGEQLTILADAARLEEDDGQIKKATFVQDITARQQVEEMRERVARITRHDLKAPLNGIINLPELLLAEENLSEEHREYLNMIRESGFRMLEIINLSHDLVKMETDCYELQAIPIDLRNLVERVLRDLGSLFRSKSIGTEASWDVAGGEPLVASGEELLSYSMFANLLKNAAEAAPRGSTVTIRGSAKGGDIRIDIHNDGAVPGQVRHRFFDKYSTYGKRDGTGLGTYSAMLIAETQNGSISMDTSEAQGTTVTVCLPAEAAGRFAARP